MHFPTRCTFLSYVQAYWRQEGGRTNTRKLEWRIRFSSRFDFSLEICVIELKHVRSFDRRFVSHACFSVVGRFTYAKGIQKQFSYRSAHSRSPDIAIGTRRVLCYL